MKKTLWLLYAGLFMQLNYLTAGSKQATAAQLHGLKQSLTGVQQDVNRLQVKLSSLKNTKIKKFIKTWRSQSKKKRNPIIDATKANVATDKDGYATADAIRELFVKYLPDFSDVTIEHVPDGSALGSYTGALFRAYRKGKCIFFIKISNNEAKDVWLKLKKIQESPIGKFNAQAMHKKGFPIIVNVEYFIRYKDANLVERMIEVMHLAKGEPIQPLIFYAALSDAGKAKIARCGAAFGRALGLLHTHFMRYNNPQDASTWRTVVHGDCHRGNVLYDDGTGRIYFIDNESMALVLNDQNKIDAQKMINPILVDLWGQNNMRHFCLPISFYGDEHKAMIEKCSLFSISFLKAYLDAYPLERRQAMANYINLFVTNKIGGHRGGFDSRYVVAFKKDFQQVLQSFGLIEPLSWKVSKNDE